MENPIKMGWFGGKTHYFRKPIKRHDINLHASYIHMYRITEVEESRNKPASFWLLANISDEKTHRPKKIPNSQW